MADLDYVSPSAVAQKHAMESCEAIALMAVVFRSQLKASSTLLSPGSDRPMKLCGTVELLE